MHGIDADNWKQGIEDKLQSIVENNTFRVIKQKDVPADRKLIGSKFIFKLK
jgi:hypothetical protein